MDSLESMLEFLRDQPVTTLFLTLGCGCLVGRIRLGGLALGAATGTLLVAIVLGRFGFRISPAAQAVGFALFIFGVGYQAGPHFVAMLKTEGLRYLALAIVVAGIGFAAAAIAGNLLTLPPGGTAGLLAGALTTTPMLAAAQQAVRSGVAAVPSGVTAEQVITTIGTSYAITYTVGMLGVIAAVKFLPRIAGFDLVVEAHEAQAEESGHRPARHIALPAELHSPDETQAIETDMVPIAFGIVLGTLIGLLSVNVAGVSLGLGASGGLLVAGLASGWLGAKRPAFGRFPEAARWVLMEFGLLIFICGIGLQAGARIVEAFHEAGPALIAAAAVVVALPVIGGYVFGRRVLRLPPLRLMGALTGAMTSGPAFRVLTGEVSSSALVLGYSGTYAFANVILTVAGTLIMLI